MAFLNCVDWRYRDQAQGDTGGVVLGQEASFTEKAKCASRRTCTLRELERIEGERTRVSDRFGAEMLTVAPARFQSLLCGV